MLPTVDTGVIFFTYATCAFPTEGGAWRCNVGVYGPLRFLGGRLHIFCPCIIGPHFPDIPLLVPEERWCIMGRTGGMAYEAGGLVAATALVSASVQGSFPAAYNCLPIAYCWPSNVGRDRCLTGITATGRLWPMTLWLSRCMPFAMLRGIIGGAAPCGGTCGAGAVWCGRCAASCGGTCCDGAALCGGCSSPVSGVASCGGVCCDGAALHGGCDCPVSGRCGSSPCCGCCCEKPAGALACSAR